MPNRLHLEAGNLLLNLAPPLPYPSTQVSYQQHCDRRHNEEQHDPDDEADHEKPVVYRRLWRHNASFVGPAVPAVFAFSHTGPCCTPNGRHSRPYAARV
jgi:hypothetical protein